MWSGPSGGWAVEAASPAQACVLAHLCRSEEAAPPWLLSSTARSVSIDSGSVCSWAATGVNPDESSATTHVAAAMTLNLQKRAMSTSSSYNCREGLSTGPANVRADFSCSTHHSLKLLLFQHRGMQAKQQTSVFAGVGVTN